MFGLVSKTEADKKARRLSAISKADLKDARRIIKQFEDRLEERRDELTVKNREHQRALTKKDARISELEEQLEVLEALENKRKEQSVQTIELANRETLLAAREKQYKSFETEIKRVKEEAKNEADAVAQQFYADGLADGLRKIHEITAEDRKMSMQVALVAASSHTPGAAKKIAASVADSMMLGAGVDAEDDEEDEDSEE